MKEFISIHNTPISIEERICGDKGKGSLYVNDYSFIYVVDGYYEFYYTPDYFIGKIAECQIPQEVKVRINTLYKKFLPREIDYGHTKAPLKSSHIRLRNMEKDMRIGNWFHAQGQNYVTTNSLFIADDMYVENCEQECSFLTIDGAIVYDMLRMGCRTRTPHYYKGIFDFPIFYNINVGELIVLTFEGLNWNATAWTKWFEIYSNKTMLYDSKGAKDEIRNMRAEVFTHTVSVVKSGEYYTELGQTIKLSDDGKMIHSTKFYSKPFQIQERNCRYNTEVRVENTDCLIAAKELKEQGYKVAVLNMASRHNPGGGVYGGAGAQEENLFRRTNLFRSMFQFAPYASQYGLKESPFQYPLDRNFGGVFTPNAIVFRDTERKGYALLDTPYVMSFISVAGMNRPELNSEGMIVDELIEPIKNKIRTIFRIGLENGFDALVLGALGCGAFKNPPKHIAHLFHEVMNELEFKGMYKLIVFAILEDHNSHKSHNKEGNFKPFWEEFNK